MLTPVPAPLRHAVTWVLKPEIFAWVFRAYALLWALAIGVLFFSSLEYQLFLSQARSGAIPTQPTWSAPLDDVFIHFDFARSAARGFPFQWSEGNGYSSGGTSLLYPFILAVGYRLGYDGLGLMLWAGIVATISVWGLLVSVARLFDNLPQGYTLLIPPVLLSVGALDWSLYSGMEIAFFLAIWGACLLVWDDVCRAQGAPAIQRRGAVLGLGCLLLVATRPESAPVVACFALTALALRFRHLDWAAKAKFLALTSLPGACVIVGQALANRWLTGETSAAGALVKLEAYHPYLSSAEVWDAWVFHLKYQIARTSNYHLSAGLFKVYNIELSSGWLLWVLAVVPLVPRATRRFGILLWLSALLWLCTVSFNGQVRWQNDRYTMPALAWLLCSCAVGLAQLLHYGVAALRRWNAPDAIARRRARMRGVALLGLAGLSFGGFLLGQAPRFRDQLWFFGRASRNITDQHIRAAELIKQTPAHRVMVGDAGAIPYVSDLPAIDIIGLGGIAGYPFARATRMGIPAALELLQRMPKALRPDVMALYPTWWKELPMWFGQQLFEVPVRGNVICGGASKVVYLADWDSFAGSELPSSKKRHEQVSTNIDFADLISEKEASVQFHNTLGYVAMKMLKHPNFEQRDLWDGGRILPQGSSATFVIDPILPHEALSLVLRLAPSSETTLRVKAGSHLETLELPRSTNWIEPRIEVPASAVREGLPIEIEALQGETILYHAWGLQIQ